MHTMKTIRILTLILLIGVTVVSCQQDAASYAMMSEEVYSIDSDRLSVNEVGAESPTQEVILISTEAAYWMVVSAPKWVKVEPMTGVGGQSTIVTLTIDSNYGDSRSGVIKFVGGRSSLSVTVNQVGIADSEDRYAGGSGTKDDPWLISRPVHMMHMSEDLESGAVKYFKMKEDVNMQDVDWTPANNEAPYDKAIDFDGNGKSIVNFNCNVVSMPSLLGVLNGSIRNVTFKDAVVGKSNAGYVGIIAGGVAEDKIVGSISNVTIDGGTVTGKQITGAMVGNAGEITFTDCVVKNTKIVSSGSAVGGIVGFTTGKVVFDGCSVSLDQGGITASKYLGGIAGRITAGGSMTGCSSVVEVNGIDNLGGLVGGATNVAFAMENSYSAAEIMATGSYIGGLIGTMQITGSSIRDCYATGFVESTGGSAIGGLVGVMAGSSLTSSYATNSVSGIKGQVGGIAGCANTSPTLAKCIAWNSAISVTQNEAGRYSCAAVVGTMFPLGTATDCVRIPGLTISGLYEETNQSSEIYHMNGVFDQDNITPDSPLKNNIGVSVSNQKIEAPNKFPYHGKAAASNETLSDVAKRLGWDQNIWDCAGETPQLKNLSSN